MGSGTVLHECGVADVLGGSVVHTDSHWVRRAHPVVPDNSVCIFCQIGEKTNQMDGYTITETTSITDGVVHAAIPMATLGDVVH